MADVVTPDPLEETGPRPRRVRPWHAVGLGFRAAVIVAIMGLGWQSVVSFSRLIGGPRPATTGPAETVAAAWPDPVATRAALWSDGGWWLAGLPWRVGVAHVAAADLEARLSSPPAPPGDAPVAALERDALRLLDALAPARRRDGAFTWSTRDEAGSRWAVATAEVGGRARLAAARFARRDPGGDWMVWEATPDPAAGDGRRLSGRDRAGLPPLPAGSAPLCTRADAAGRIVFELAQVPGTPGELSRFWTARGWSARQAPATGRDRWGWVVAAAGPPVRFLQIEAAAPARPELVLVLSRVPEADRGGRAPPRPGGGR